VCGIEWSFCDRACEAAVVQGLNVKRLLIVARADEFIKNLIIKRHAYVSSFKKEKFDVCIIY